MFIRIVSRHEFLAGLFFAALGLLVACAYLWRTALADLRIGTDHFPLLLAAILLSIGLLALRQCLAGHAPPDDRG